MTEYAPTIVQSLIVRAESAERERDELSRLADEQAAEITRLKDWLTKTEAQAREVSIALNKVDEQRIAAEQQAATLRALTCPDADKWRQR